jgi:two-component system, chemotaxis family, CheB/CheR fusion protein
MADNNKGPANRARSDRGDPSKQVIVVGIGASAGGIQALQKFFDALPKQTGAAFVVVVHLDPDSHSELAHILAARTAMAVVQAEGTQRLEPNCVYVIAPNRRLQISDHDISAVEFDEPRGRRAPIDLFFRSLAEHGDGIAVILSGAGADGAVGVKAVKEAGGIIMVQDPAEAEYSSMPRNAIATGVIDFVLPVRSIATRLVELLLIKKNLALPFDGSFDEEEVRRILAHLRVRTGHDFSRYKRSTVLRRIARRMQVTRTDELKDYYGLLREKPDEGQALLADLLISVTTFFRDRQVFDMLKASVLPQLFDGREAGESIRVWVSGCATGEEAYSIAMLLLEESSRRDIRPAIQLFGSDLDIRALGTARAGAYPAAIEADVNEERLRRFFTRQGDQYRLRQEVRDLVLFANHDLLKDPPFSRIDLISCRNVLIYLDRELQEQVISTFHYATNPGAFLVLGSSESADNPPGLFRTIDRNTRIYQSNAHAGDKPRQLPRQLGPMRSREQVPFARVVAPAAALSEAALHRRATENVAPPSMLVDETHRVLHLSDKAGRYLLPSGGPLSGDAVALVRPELRFELRSALHRAFEQRLATLSLPILVRFNSQPHRVHLHVKPSDGQDEQTDGEHHALVMFIEGEAVEEGPVSAGQATDETAAGLSQELELTQARLRTVREESESANEELRAANEELQSINEEYRSTSEELETSREELQSVNEELQTLNTELKLKLETASRANSDLQNLMAATEFGTLFLDSMLRIKRFTDRVTELFSITPTDEGRPITDLAHQLEYNDLVKDMRAVISDLTPIRRELRSRAGHWYEMRMRPYRTLDDRIDGVVLTFMDVSDRRQVEEALRERERQLRQQKQLVDMSRDSIFVWDFDGCIVEWNRGSEELYGYSRAEATGKRKEELLGTDERAFSELMARLLKEGSWAGEIKHRTKDGRAVTVEARLQLESFDGRRLVLESTREVGGKGK